MVGPEPPRRINLDPDSEQGRALVAQAPPLGPRQRERLRALLDLGGGNDGDD
jgi:hypothetical protein